MIKPRIQLEGMIPFHPGESTEDLKIRYQLSSIDKMSDNENPYGTSPNVKEAIKKNLDNLNFYPSGNCSKLVNLLAEYHQQPIDRFIIGNGSDELIHLLARAYINPGDEAVMADATFPRYQTNVLIEGGRAVTVPLKEGFHDLDGLVKEINEQTKLVFICNPNNPTGTIVGRQNLLSFIQTVPPDVLIVVDEAYAEYVTSIDYLETTSVLDQYPNLVVLRTFSKIYGLAGLRVGYGMMHPDIAKELTKAKDVFNVNYLGELAAMTALEDQDFIKQSSFTNAEQREYLYNQLQRAGLSPFPSETNFLFIPLKDPSSELYEALLKNGLLVKMMSLPGIPYGMRVTLGTKEVNQRFLQVMNFFSKESVV
ncbi:MAG: histidinol-phosphate transaminase [Bacillota bacterium]|nr:histidinol-phosphate transaminase [Bacillota bacterium]MDP4169822.1 histidinol-phosphate transaminase [Bacillota bacterium]